MDTTMQARVAEYLEVYKVIRGEVDDVEAATAILNQIGKDLRTQQIVGCEPEARKSGNGENPATQKQLDFLRDLGVEAPENVSKQEASRLIDEAQGNAA